jgi:putative methionine-R-sulfoxide reductase with GAF domain
MSETRDLRTDSGVPIESDGESRLAALRALTDTALTRLDDDEFLDELLRRVLELLNADTGAVLFLDAATQELVPRAACGLEEELHENVHIPLGAGFAGRIAATKAAVRLDRVDATTVANPILWEKGIRTMLGVPLVSGEEAVGVLHVGRLEPKLFTVEDVDLLEVVAERVVGAAQHRELALEQAAARLLERSLLPSSLPKCDGLELAARYAPVTKRIVGGDWYDVFTLPSGRMWLAVGDVAGHGLRAAVIMGRIRSAFRSYALLGGSPADVLDLVDRKVRHFEIGTFATIVCASIDPPYDEISIAVAGHPPPMLAIPGQDAALVPVHVTPPVGSGFDVQRTAVTIPLAKGSVLLFYTDGLIERRNESIDVGLERLRTAVRAARADTVAGEVMHALLANTVPFDDVAALVVRRT